MGFNGLSRYHTPGVITRGDIALLGKRKYSAKLLPSGKVETDNKIVGGFGDWCAAITRLEARGLGGFRD